MESNSSEILNLLIDADDVGKRLDQLLAAKLPNFSRTQLHHQITDLDVLVNDKPSKPSYKVRSGDRIEVELPPPPVIELIPEPLPLDIVYEDKDLLVLNKPAGLVVHPAAGIDRGTLANRLAAYLDPSEASGSPMRPGIVHRLDKDTSGLMVVAKNQDSYKKLCDQFAKREVYKEYTALVYGQMPTEFAVISLPIGRHGNQRTKMAVQIATGRPAWSRYQVMKKYSKNFSLLEVEIKTGRTHQIRVHLAHINHSVVGDEVYGTGRSKQLNNKKLEKTISNLNRHFLHASKLVFNHPTTKIRLTFSSSLPLELESFLKNIEVDS